MKQLWKALYHRFKYHGLCVQYGEHFGLLCRVTRRTYFRAWRLWERPTFVMSICGHQFELRNGRLMHEDPPTT